MFLCFCVLLFVVVSVVVCAWLILCYLLQACCFFVVDLSILAVGRWCWLVGVSVGWYWWCRWCWCWCWCWLVLVLCWSHVFNRRTVQYSKTVSTGKSCTIQRQYSPSTGIRDTIQYREVMYNTAAVQYRTVSTVTMTVSTSRLRCNSTQCRNLPVT